MNNIVDLQERREEKEYAELVASYLYGDESLEERQKLHSEILRLGQKLGIIKDIRELFLNSEFGDRNEK